MRIIAGTHRGQRLDAPKTEKIRPTADRVKCAIFSMINEKIYKANVLDLFCGSGALGLETLSRGAKHCTFVDKDRTATRLTVENIERLKLAENSTYTTKAAEIFIKETDDKFDIILIDPPYFNENVYKILENISSLLTENAIVVAEHAKTIDMPENFTGLTRVKYKTYGTVAVSVYAQSKE